jgi:hypothetical protein
MWVGKSHALCLEWQNQFDERIMEVALETGVPAQLMKNLFAKESQFWPGVFQKPEHMGWARSLQKEQMLS